MALTSNRAVLDWIDEMAAMTQPDQLVWIDGSEAQLEELRKQACASGEIEKLNEEKLPGCYLHRTAVNDVARVEDRTFICCKKQEDAGPTNHWMDPQEMYAKLKKLYTGAMKGRTMYVIPYSMGVVGSPFAKYGIELTDSIYVVLNMAIMTRVGRAVADVMGPAGCPHHLPLHHPGPGLFQPCHVRGRGRDGRPCHGGLLVRAALGLLCGLHRQPCGMVLRLLLPHPGVLCSPQAPDEGACRSAGGGLTLAYSSPSGELLLYLQIPQKPLYYI